MLSKISLLKTGRKSNRSTVKDCFDLIIEDKFNYPPWGQLCSLVKLWCSLFNTAFTHAYFSLSYSTLSNISSTGFAAFFQNKDSKKWVSLNGMLCFPLLFVMNRFQQINKFNNLPSFIEPVICLFIFFIKTCYLFLIHLKDELQKVARNFFQF